MSEKLPKINPAEVVASLHQIAVLCEKFGPFADRQPANIPSMAENTASRESDAERHSVNPASGA